MRHIKNHLHNCDSRDIMTYVNGKKGDLGETLLHYYASSDNEPKHKEVCHLLITYGADINSLDKFETTPLHRAVVACKLGITQLLLNYGAHVNAQDANKNTPLHNASTLDLKLCEFLLTCGADPNIKNNFNQTPIFRAVQGFNNALPHCKQIIKLMLDYGGDVLIKDLNQHNAIEVAARLHNKDVFHWCEQNVQNSTGKKLIIMKFGLFSSDVAKSSSH